MNIDAIRQDFPTLAQKVHGEPLVYLDNAATTLRPKPVINILQKYYFEQNANVHRGNYYLAQLSTDLYEQARNTVKAFINASLANECVFVRSTTEAINLVANGFTHTMLQPGDEIILSQTEHHANIVPWQLACQYSGATLKVIPCNDRGELRLDKFIALLNKKTKMVAVSHVSNALGTINPIKDIIDLAHQNGSAVLIDGAQAISHLQVDVQTLDCDFYCFSAHKMYGPFGAGILYAKKAWLDRLPPFLGGGEMIKSVRFESTLFNDPPLKFEAGTMPIADIIGMKTAIDYLQNIGYPFIQDHENALLQYALNALSTISNLRVIGTATHHAPVISFLLGDIHPHDVGTVLDYQGIAVRTGQHCAEPTMDRFGVNATIRASFAVYNTIDEIDRLIKGLHQANKLFKG